MIAKDCFEAISIDYTAIPTNFKSLMVPVPHLKFEILRNFFKLTRQSSIMDQVH
jgi:hypothetical protein